MGEWGLGLIGMGRRRMNREERVKYMSPFVTARCALGASERPLSYIFDRRHTYLKYVPLNTAAFFGVVAS